MTASPPPYKIMSVKPKPMLSKCCFFFPLRTGCLILGYVTLIINIFHTITILGITTIIGITTHGFDHFDHDRHGLVSKNETAEGPFLTQVAVLLALVTCVNVTWLAINVACLVGLHKNRPGPIRVFVVFAVIRLLFSVVGFAFWSESGMDATLTKVADLALSSYFIFIYYIHAKQLAMEQTEGEEKPSSNYNENISIIYPIKSEKQILV